MNRLIAFIIFLVISGPSAAQPLQVTDAWIKNLPPTISMRAGYMQLMNLDAKTATIVSISSDAFKKIEMHNTINNDGVMSMHSIKSLVLEANGMMSLKPGSMHLMLMKPTRELKIGDEVEIVLQFDNNTSQAILMTVRK